MSCSLTKLLVSLSAAVRARTLEVSASSGRLVSIVNEFDNIKHP